MTPDTERKAITIIAAPLDFQDPEALDAAHRAALILSEVAERKCPEHWDVDVIEGTYAAPLAGDNIDGHGIRPTPTRRIAASLAHDTSAPLIIRHTFTVPVENIGGQNHGRDSWLAYMVDISGIDVTGLDNDNDKYPGWLIDYQDSGAHDTITVQGSERLLRFLCVLFDLHAEQYPGDPTPPGEANKLDRAIERAQAAHLAKQQGWLTVGQLREVVADEPDDKLVTIYDGNQYTHAQIISSQTLMPGEEPDPTIILATTTPFNTRDI